MELNISEEAMENFRQIAIRLLKEGRVDMDLVRKNTEAGKYDYILKNKKANSLDKIQDR